MKKAVFTSILALFLLFLYNGPAEAQKVTPFDALTGGATGALDKKPVASIADGDRAIVVTSANVYHYLFDADGTGAESSPAVIRPDDYSTQGTWLLVEVYLASDQVDSSHVSTVVQSAMWVGAGMTPDGTQCADASDVQINSGPYQSTIICADNDASTLYGNVQMPDSWDAGNVTFELAYIQTAADTNVLNGDITIQCRGAGETVNNTWETEVAMDDAAVTGSNAIDHLTSGNVSGTCVAGDTLYWRWQMDATGTTTAVATLHFVGMKMEYTSNVGD